MFAEGALAHPSFSSSSSSSSSEKGTCLSSRFNNRRAKLCFAAASEHMPSSSNARFVAASQAPFRATIRNELQQIISDFNSHEPIERASTPPSSWYTHPHLLAHEMETVFWRGWQVVGFASQVEKPYAYFTGSLGRMQYIVCRDGQGELHGFHNVCRHHAAPIATGSGCKAILQCPYHGERLCLKAAQIRYVIRIVSLQYGRFQKATQLTGIQNFKAYDNGLLPISIATWGPFVLLNFSGPTDELKADYKSVGKDWLGDASPILESSDIDAPLCHVAKKEYLVNCNWKVFCDNYLDGGYHVPIAHKNLASGLNLASYSTQVLQRVSIQSCKTEAASDRLGQAALYAFVYPNFMINRYGPWMDTNLVIPVETSKCLVIFDYFLDPLLVDDKEFIQQSLSDSEIVQMEDIVLCEGVQKGLESPAFRKGRYVPAVEMAMHHFHCLLQQDLMLML